MNDAMWMRYDNQDDQGNAQIKSKLDDDILAI
jgi:hypothetical protein